MSENETNNKVQSKAKIAYGYKALSGDMCAVNGDGMKYELKKWYKVEGEIRPCENGFHFCKKLEDTYSYYDSDDERGFRLFKVAAKGEVVDCDDDEKPVAGELHLIKELTPDEIDNYFIKNANRLVNDESWKIRRELVRRDLCLDKLVNDKHWNVRLEIAKQGKYLDRLVGDKDWRIRLELVRQGKYLDRFVNDKDWFIRLEIARQGKYLDRLVDDEYPDVRLEIAEQGKYLDRLVDDKDLTVRDMARKKLAEQQSQK